MKIRLVHVIRLLRVLGVLFCVTVMLLPLFMASDESERDNAPEDPDSQAMSDEYEQWQSPQPFGDSETSPEPGGMSEPGVQEAPSLQEPNMAAGYVLLPHERVVTNYAQLKDALANNNGVTTVYFGANITMQATGVHIHSSKTHVVVSGMNPLTPDQTQPYTLTDHTSATFVDTVYIDSSGVSSLLVRDLTIVGKNYYGSFSVLDGTVTNKLVVTYQRVNYSGPSLMHHRRGSFHIIDCHISISGKNGGSPIHEFSEVKSLRFEGNTVIDIAPNTLSIFWHPVGGSFELADDASVTLTAPDMPTAFGMFYADAGSIAITIGQRASFNAAISGTVALPAQATLSSLTVREGGSFRIETTKSATNSILVMGGALTVERNASFAIKGYGGTDDTVLEQRTGDIVVGQDASFHITADRAYARLLDVYGNWLWCNDPASVLFYNPSKRTIQAVSAVAGLYANAQQVNYWTAANPSGFDNPPLYGWKKPGDENFWIKGSLNIGSSGNLTAASSNYTIGDPPGVAPDATTFNMISARVLSFGRLELRANAMTAATNAVTGVTAPGAAVRASFTQEGEAHTLPETVADANGAFSIPVGMPLAGGTVIHVESVFQYLTAQTSVMVDPEGKIDFLIPDTLWFYTTMLSTKAQTVHRLESGWNILVSDTRGAGNGWRVYARVTQPLTCVNIPAYVLQGALVFVNDDGSTLPLDDTEPLLIKRHTTATDNEVVPIQWAANRGILLRVPGNVAYVGQYTAQIEWILIDAP